MHTNRWREYCALMSPLVFITVAACGSDDPVSPPPPPPPPVGVALTPATAAVPAGGSQPFSATVTNAANTAVTWSASGGTISGTGTAITWLAPATGGSFTVTAASVEDPTKSANATVTVSPATVTLAPATAALFRGQPQTFTATVTGVAEGETGVTWAVSCGTSDAAGATLSYTAPTTSGECTVTATSTLDPTQTATATVTVRPEWLVGTTDDSDDGACTWTHCSLREALAAAQASAEPAVIHLGTTAAAAGGTGVPAANAPVTGTITLTSALPNITTPVEIRGPGAAQLTIDANASTGNLRRVFTITGDVAVTVSGMTVRGGRQADGGGILAIDGADVTLKDLIIRENEATIAGGGFRVADGSTARLENVTVEHNTTGGGTGGAGGGIRVDGAVLEMTGGHIRQNAANIGGGLASVANNSSATLTNVTISDNTSNAQGGGVSMGLGNSNVTLTISGGAVRENTAGGLGGGVYFAGDGNVLTVTGTVIAENTTSFAGGGIFTNGEGPRTITGAELRNNTANSGGGGIHAFAGTIVLTGTDILDNVTGAGTGGGINLLAATTATITGSTIRGNEANTGGGLSTAGELTIVDSEIANNRALVDHGGGLRIVGTGSRTVTRAIISGNTANLTGAGISAVSGSLVIEDSEILDNVAGTVGGGASSGATTTIRRTLFSGNTGSSAGGLQLSPAPGTSHLVEQSEFAENEVTGSAGGVFIVGSGSVAIADVTIRDNQSGQFGGGLAINGASVTATRLHVTGNESNTFGGGIYLTGSGTLTLTNSAISGNSATLHGGGFATVSALTTVTLDGVTLSGNSTPGLGGGIFSRTPNTTIRNVTLSGNSAAVGGGLALHEAFNLTNVTIVGNTATELGGGVAAPETTTGQFQGSGTLTLRNVLLSGNQVNGAAGNCGTNGAGSILSTGNNLSDDATCGGLTMPGDKPDTPAGVSATLADNGGPTWTHALQAGSAAIDAGLPAVCPATDQRGFGRTGPCDIGSFEFGGTPPAGAALNRGGASTRRPLLGRHR